MSTGHTFTPSQNFVSLIGHTSTIAQKSVPFSRHMSTLLQNTVSLPVILPHILGQIDCISSAIHLFVELLYIKKSLSIGAPAFTSLRQSTLIPLFLTLSQVTWFSFSDIPSALSFTFSLILSTLFTRYVQPTTPNILTPKINPNESNIKVNRSRAEYNPCLVVNISSPPRLLENRRSPIRALSSILFSFSLSTILCT